MSYGRSQIVNTVFTLLSNHYSFYEDGFKKYVFIKVSESDFKIYIYFSSFGDWLHGRVHTASSIYSCIGNIKIFQIGAGSPKVLKNVSESISLLLMYILPIFWTVSYF